MGDLEKARAEPLPIVAATDAEREYALALLRDALATEDLSLEVFSSTASAIVEARSQAELIALVRSYSPTVRMTPPDRRMDEPLSIETSSGTLALTESWQVPREMYVSCRSGRVTLDLAKAEFDDDLVDIDLRCVSGTIEVIVPHAVDVQFVRMVGKSGRIDNQLTSGATPFATAVRIRISAETTSGRIIVRRPRPPKDKTRRRWFRRAQTASIV